MGIFKFIKKMLAEPEKTESVSSSISFSEIDKFLQEKINETKKKEKQEIITIKEKIRTFTKELRENIKVVNEVDIEQKEKNDKVKSVVYEGRKKYTEFLERFIENIEDIDKDNLQEVTELINSAFLRFNENSAKSYERATILIGKEMGNIRETLKKLSGELIEIFNYNKDVILTSKRIQLIKSKNAGIEEIDNKLLEINKDISSIINKINNKEEETKKISENIDKIKKSKEYLENIEKEKNIQYLQEEFEKGIYQLKQLIDFKALSNFFHIFEDRMAIVKLYRENFIEEFKKDMGSRLLNLLNESKLNTEKIYDSIKNLADKEKDILTEKKEIKEDETQPLLLNIENIKEEINNLKKENEGIEKKKEKLDIDKKVSIDIIKKELLNMNINLE